MADVQTLQLVDAEGDYNTDGMQAFARQCGLDNAGVDYQIVAVMGPQSSGKSTLMNAVVRERRPVCRIIIVAALRPAVTPHHLV